jgi:DNA-binding protein WhiA
MRLVHNYLDLQTMLTVRKSVQRKTRNYLIEIPEQERLADDLARLGILVPGRGLATGVPPRVGSRLDMTRAFVRGAFMAGGFVADPHGDFHLEIAVTGESFAQGIVELVQGLGATARLNHRRGSYAVYLKSYEDVRTLLIAMGAKRSARTVDNVRQLKSVKNAVNRRVNAEVANERRSSRSGADQTHVVRRVDEELGFQTLPPALREFCELRLKNLGDQIALNTGIGARYDLGFLVLRVDFGLGLHAPYKTRRSGYFNLNPIKDGFAWHFGIGYPF